MEIEVDKPTDPTPVADNNVEADKSAKKADKLSALLGIKPAAEVLDIEAGNIREAFTATQENLDHVKAASARLSKLHRAAMEGDWKEANEVFSIDETAKTQKLSNLGLTAIHVAASCGRSAFVEEMVKQLKDSELETRDQLGRTALHHAALAADVRAAQAIVMKNPKLLLFGDMDRNTPLLYAAKWRHQSKSKDMLEYLCSVTKNEPPLYPFTGDLAPDLIVAITATGSCDSALGILKKYCDSAPKLAYAKNEEGTSVLHVLATQPSAFRSGSKLSLWKSLIYEYFVGGPDDDADNNAFGQRPPSAASFLKLGKRKLSSIKKSHFYANKLVEFVCQQLQNETSWFVQEYLNPKQGPSVLHLAIEHGVIEVVRECLKYFPDLIWYPASNNRLLLHSAIEHRRAEIFNYIINMNGENTKAYSELELQEDDNNNALHLAAKLAPTPQLHSVPGPAFQMQRELQWFKAVEAIVYYQLRTKKNSKGQTPRDLFFDAHNQLLGNAKDWLKETSNACMVVATLVATVAFAAMITVPGGNDTSTGMPVLAKKKLFLAFSISNALSMISSAVSLLMFLSIHTSRYTEEDFLESLPKILLRGLISLFVAVATMMISFGTAIGLSLQTRINWAYIPITIVACCPAIIFTWLQLPLLLQMLVFQSGPGISQQQSDRKIWSLGKIRYRLLANEKA